MQTATQQTSEADLNKLNGAMRAMPWYQQFFKERGLDPNKVKLSSQQREALSGLAAQNGYQLGSRMKFDEAGNINQNGGFAGMPTWAKVAIAAAPVAGAMMIPGAQGAVVGGIKAAGGALAHTASSVVPGATSTTSAAAPSVMSRIAGMVKDPLALIGAGGRMISQAGQASANNRGAEIETRLAYDQLNLQKERERKDAESDAFRKSLYGQIASGYQPSQRPDGIPSRNPAGGFVTDQAREAGQMMTDTAMQRMRTQDYPSITPYSQLPTKPGMMERIANYAGPAMSLFDPRLYDKNGQPHA